MIPELEQDPKFETLRNLPTELSQEQVLSIIAILPTLPLGNNWIDLLYSNSIAMKTIVFGIICSAVIYFTASPSKAPLLSDNQSPVTKVTDTLPDKTVISPNIPEISNQKGLISTPEIQAISPIVSLANTSEILDTTPSNIQRIKDDLIQLDADTLIQQGAGLALEEPILPDIKEAIILPRISKVPKIQKVDSIKRINIKGEFEYDKGYPGYSNLRVGRIKKALLKNLIRDQLIISREADNVLELQEDKIIVNGKMLDPIHYKKYVEMLNKFGVVHTGPYHQVRVSTRYIMLGDFGPHGFRGRAKGRNMQLDISVNEPDLSPLIE